MGCRVQAESAARIASLEGSLSAEHLKAAEDLRAAEEAKQAIIVRDFSMGGPNGRLASLLCVCCCFLCNTQGLVCECVCGVGGWALATLLCVP